MLEQMVSWQRRALSSLCGRVDLLQADIDRQASAQTELESRLLDLERELGRIAMRPYGGCCARCGSAVENSAALAAAQWRAAVGVLGGPLLQARCESRAFSFDPRSKGPVAR